MTRVGRIIPVEALKLAADMGAEAASEVATLLSDAAPSPAS